MSAQGFEGRFTEKAADFLRALVEAATTSVLEAAAPGRVLKRFNGVYLSDSTRLEGKATGLKVATQLELQRGGLSWTLEAIHTHDNASGILRQPLPVGALHVGDLGLFDLERFAQWRDDGVDWLTRYKSGVRLFHLDGQACALFDLLRTQPQSLHVPVLVGQQRVPMYLVAQALPPTPYRQRLRRLKETARRKQQPLSATQKRLARWTIYLTSLADLSFHTLHILYRARWQIERLFKRWKSLGKLATSTSADPQRQACERYAKLLAVLIAHWCSVALCWHTPHASRDGAFVFCQHYAPLLYAVCFRFPALLPMLDAFFLSILPSLTLSKRKNAPNACDLWALFDACP